VIYWHMCPAYECAVEGATRPDFLSVSEHKTYQGLRFPKRRHEWLLGRWTAKQLLRNSLTSYQSLALEAISVANDPDGAPYLAVEGEGRLPVSLSISHRAGRAVCALSPAAWGGGALPGNVFHRCHLSWPRFRTGCLGG